MVKDRAYKKMRRVTVYGGRNFYYENNKNKIGFFIHFANLGNLFSGGTKRPPTQKWIRFGATDFIFPRNIHYMACS